MCVPKGAVVSTTTSNESVETSDALFGARTRSESPALNMKFLNRHGYPRAGQGTYRHFTNLLTSCWPQPSLPSFTLRSSAQTKVEENIFRTKTFKRNPSVTLLNNSEHSYSREGPNFTMKFKHVECRRTGFNWRCIDHVRDRVHVRVIVRDENTIYGGMMKTFGMKSSPTRLWPLSAEIVQCERPPKCPCECPCCCPWLKQNR